MSLFISLVHQQSYGTFATGERHYDFNLEHETRLALALAYCCIGERRYQFAGVALIRLGACRKRLILILCTTPVHVSDHQGSNALSHAGSVSYAVAAGCSVLR